MRLRALHDRRAIRGSPIGLLHRLVERANQGLSRRPMAFAIANSAAAKAHKRSRPFEQRKRGSASATGPRGQYRGWRYVGASSEAETL